MKTIWCITKRETGAYFKSPIAYVILAAFAAINSILFFNDNFFIQRTASLSGLFGTFPLIFLLFAPALSMRLLAEERGTGTFQLLVTMPVHDYQIVVGKFLSAIFVLFVALVCTFPIAITVSGFGPLDWGAVFSGYLGSFLLGSIYISIGLLGSALTKEQIVAFMLGMTLCFITFSLRWFIDSSALGYAIRYAAPDFHFLNLQKGFVEFRTIIYFLSVIFAFLALSTHSLTSRRWK